MFCLPYYFGQDTVKYVENQVQTVGESVKRFYSDVMEDLLPPSLLDSEKVSDGSFSVKQNSDDRIYNKPNGNKKEKLVKVDFQQLTENGKDVGVHCSVDDLSKASSGNCVEAASSDVCLQQDCDGRQYGSSNLGVEENPNMERLPLTEASCRDMPIEKQLSWESSPSYKFLNETHEAPSHQTDTSAVQSVAEDANGNSIAEISNVVESANHCASSDVLSAESNGDYFLGPV